MGRGAGEREAQRAIHDFGVAAQGRVMRAQGVMNWMHQKDEQHQQAHNARGRYRDIFVAEEMNV